MTPQMTEAENSEVSFGQENFMGFSFVQISRVWCIWN